MIKLESISKIYPSHPAPITALHDINLHVKAGEIAGIIGRSGAGKSSLIRCVNLLERPSSGRVLLDDCDITALTSKELNQKRLEMGMIFQHFNLQTAKTVFDNIALPLIIQKKSSSFIQTKVTELLDRVELPDKANVYPNQLSGGQKQRVAIARALATQPKILLCDEATSALDPKTTQTILSLLKSLNHEMNLTIILITHEMDVVKQICDTMSVLEQGMIIETGKTLSLFRYPQHPVTQSLVHQSLNDELSPEIQARYQEIHADPNKRLVRLHFFGHRSEEPIISHLVSRFQLIISILQANINYVDEESMGTMIVEIIAEPQRWEEAARFLREEQIDVEELTHD